MDKHPLPKLTHGSLFSGIGGFELGAQWAGIETRWACEIEPFQRSILQKNFSNTHLYDDIRKLPKPPYVDIVSGGFPCQDISLAGRGKGIFGERSGLWSEMLRVVDGCRPAFVIIENSPALRFRGLDRVLSDLAQIGYHAEWQCLSGRSFGIQQRRERIYIIAHATEVRPLHHPQEQAIFSKALLEKVRWRPPEDAYSHLSTQWSDDAADISYFREYNDLSPELHRIGALGNAVIPQVAFYLFGCILEFVMRKKLSQQC